MGGDEGVLDEQGDDSDAERQPEREGRDEDRSAAVAKPAASGEEREGWQDEDRRLPGRARERQAQAAPREGRKGARRALNETDEQQARGEEQCVGERVAIRVGQRHQLIRVGMEEHEQRDEGCGGDDRRVTVLRLRNVPARVQVDRRREQQEYGHVDEEGAVDSDGIDRDRHQQGKAVGELFDPEALGEVGAEAEPAARVGPGLDPVAEQEQVGQGPEGERQPQGLEPRDAPVRHAPTSVSQRSRHAHEYSSREFNTDGRSGARQTGSRCSIRGDRSGTPSSGRRSPRPCSDQVYQNASTDC